MKPKLILTTAQAKEMKWFCDNCTGLHQEFYSLREKVEAFASKLERLNKTSNLIEKFLAKAEESEVVYPPVENSTPHGTDIFAQEG